MLSELLSLQMTANRAVVTRWLTWISLATMFSTACWFLSQWQFARAEEVQEANSIVLANYERTPVALEELLPQEATWDKALEYRQVKVSGNYLPEDTYLIRNRPNAGYPGFLQLVAFKTDSETIIWIERGWLPTGSKQDAPDLVPAVDKTHREITVRLRPTEPKLDRGAPVGQLPSIDLVAASVGLSGSVYDQAYGRLVTEFPELPKGEAMPMPELNQGNHLSYAMQWLLFALMAFGAVYWTIAQDRRRAAGLAPRKLKFLTKDSDAEAEDKILG
ncbi:MAG: SURF1 family protein [Actinobacteria bacterium]|nr:SURF1 family protein [Actinomycetota bacterium]